MGFLFGGGGRHAANLAPEFTGLQVQTAVNTMPIPILYGTPRVNCNLIYYTDFQAHAVKSGSSGKGGGKGLLGGGKSGGGTTSYTYRATIILALGEGFLAMPLVVFQNQGLYNLAGLPNGGALTFFNGAPGQAPWGFFASAHGSDSRSYAYTSYLAGQNYPLDSSATVPQFNMLTPGHLQGTCPLYRANYTIANANAPASPAQQTVVLNLDMSADPALVIQDFLTNAQYGVPGFPSSLIDGSLLSGPNATNLAVGDSAFQTYCQAVGFGFDVVLNSTEQASAILDRWAKLLGTAIVWTGTTLKFIPYWDTATQANPGYDSGNEAGIAKKYFVPNTTALFSLTDDDFVQAKDQDPVTYERIDTADVYNTVRLDFKDRTNLWNNNVAEAKDENDIELNGIRVDSLGSANEFTIMAFAANSAQVVVQRNSAIRLRYSFKLSWEFCLLEPLDIVQISDTRLGLSRFPVRITAIEEDEHGQLSITSEEFPVGAQSAVMYPKQAYGGGVFNTNVPSNSVNKPFIFEPTSAQLTAQGHPATPVIAIGLSASLPGTGAADPNFGGADIYVSNDNVTYALLGRFTGVSDMGVLTAGFSAYGGANPDTVDTLSVDLTESGGQLVTVTVAQAQAGLTACAVYNAAGNLEILSYTTATLTAPHKYNLTGLYRGLYGTTAAASTIGQQFIYIGAGNYFSTNLPPQFVGVPIFFKFPAFNTLNSTEQSLAFVQVYEYLPTGNVIIALPSCAITFLDALEAATAEDCGTFGGVGSCTIDLGVFNTTLTSGLTAPPPIDLGAFP